MGRSRGACKFLGMIFALSLLVQGICAAQTDNEINPELNSTYAFEWVLLLPIFIGSLLFLTWMCRFFDRMNFCFITFLLMAILLGLLSTNLISGETRQFLINLVIIITVIVVLYEGLFTQRDGNIENAQGFIEKLKNSIENNNNPFIPIIILAILIMLITLIISSLSEFFLVYNILRGISSQQLIFIIIPIVILYTAISKRESSNLIMDLHDISRNFIVILTILIWPMVILYFYLNEINYITFYRIERLGLPVYVIAASYIGVLSYLLLSIEETFGHFIPEYKKISIAWSYLRRIIIAPFIAILGFYMLHDLQNINELDEINGYFVFVFSFFAGFFTKTIEDWIYLWVQKLLPGDKQKEFNERTECKVKESDLVKKLGCDEDLAYMLYNAKIRTIEELATCDANELLKKVNIDTRNLGEGIWCPIKVHKGRVGSYSEKQIQKCVDKAREYLGIDKSKLVTVLKMDKDLASRLYSFANIKTIEDLSTRNVTYICNRLSTCSNGDVNNIEKYIKKSIHYMDMEKSDLVTGLGMSKDLAFKISYHTDINSIDKLKDEKTEDIHDRLAEFKEDVSKETINEYIEKAKISKSQLRKLIWYIKNR